MSFKNLKKSLSVVLFLLFVFSSKGFSKVTDFSPKTISTGSILTITGSGFGSTRGVSYISFPRELSPDQSSILPVSIDYLVWTDNEIQVRVPNHVATGRPFAAINGTEFYVLEPLTISNTVEITSFSPTSISAGTQSLLTINGKNFGSSPGTVFTRSSSINSTMTAAGTTKIVSWTDTKIVVSVNESAGSGQIALLINGNMIYSSSSLYVKFAVFGSPTGIPIILSNTNGIGGYTFRMENSFAANTDANSTFNKALNTWKSATGVNWQMGANTSVNTESARDNVNVVKFGAPEEIIVGTLAYTAIHYQTCASGELVLGDIDIIFNRDYNWNFTNNAPAPDQYDFETVALHELGHAHGLVHVNNIGDPMYHTIDPGTTKRLLTPQAIEGGSYMLNNSTEASGRTCNEVMTSPAPTLTSFSPTMATNGEIVTIIGSNFLRATDVYFGTTKATSFTVVSSTIITATLAAGSSGNVTVVTSGGSAVLAGFNYQTKRSQTLTSVPLPVKTYGDMDFDPGVIASSGLPVTYSSSNLAVATIINNKIHIVGAGNALITANQAGNETYSATSINLNLVVNKLNQQISFPALSAKLISDPDFDPSATTTSGLRISYFSSNTAVATIINSKVHIIGIGSTIITAIQEGNAIYNAAADVSQNLNVFNLPTSNFTIRSTDETCKTSDNGTIHITATQILSYTATVTGNNKTTIYPFNSILTINNLPAGLYNVCITVAGLPNYKQCFNISIKEPKDLAAYSSLKNDESLVVLKLEGSDFYKIELNGQLTTTTQQEITLPLIKGSNVVKISSDKTCQGVIEKVFLTTGGISLFPNPVKDILNISTGRIDSSPTRIDIHAVDGRLVHSSQQLAGNGRISVDLSRLSKGVYVLTLSIGNTKTVHKIIKD